MIMDLEKQKVRVQEAMQTALIVKDQKSRFELSVEILRLSRMMTLTEADLLRLRERFDLRSDVWILAELKVRDED